MATSSIFHNFLLDDEETIKRFIDAFDASMDEEQPPVPDHIHILRDPKEIQETLARMRAKFAAEEQEAMKNVG